MEHGLELIQSYPGNRWKFDFYNFLISWKYWKSDFSNFSYPGNTGNRFFLFSHILEILEIGFSYFLIFWKYGRRAGGGGQAAPGVVLCCLGSFLEHVSWNFRISWKYWKYVFLMNFWIFPKKARAEISRKMHRRKS